MEWNWQWFMAGVAGLLGLGLVRGLLKILTPVAVVGVLSYGITTLYRRVTAPPKPRPAVSRARQPATTATR